MFIPVSLSTPHEKLLNIFEIPIIGPLLALIVADLPVAVLSILGLISLQDTSSRDGLIMGLSIAAWNFFLRKKYGTSVKVFGIPFEIFGLLVAVIGFFGFLFP